MTGIHDSVRRAADTIDLEMVVTTVVERCVETVFAQHGSDDDFREHLRVSVRQNAYALRDVLAGRIRLSEVPLDQVLWFATVQARLRIPQMSMHRSYRISFLAQWEMWTAHLAEQIAASSLSREEATDALSQLTRTLLRFQDHVESQVAETYTRDHEVLSRSREHVRRSLVRDVLRGDDGKLTPADLAVLDHPLDGHHVAVLLPAVAEEDATHVAEALRPQVHADSVLTYPLALNRSVVWLCRRDPWSTSDTGALGKHLDALAVTASVGSPEPGVDGFRRTLQQATEVERVRAAWGSPQAPPVISHPEVALDVLLLQDEPLAGRFVEAELGELAADSPEAIRLRDTLEASFRLGSHVATAEHLGVHEHTVRNRLGKAEQILGRSLQDRRTELQVALRLVRLRG
jgi:PucR C-terminal helix-turn-helix domain/GGDEF-like domain